MKENNGERVTNKQLYQALFDLDRRLSDELTNRLDNMPSRSWVLKTVGGALIVGQVATRFAPDIDNATKFILSMIL